MFTVAERRRWDTKVFPQLRRIVAEYQPDILESRNVKSHFLVRMLGLHKKCRWVAWNHGYTATSLLDRSLQPTGPLVAARRLSGSYGLRPICRQAGKSRHRPRQNHRPAQFREAVRSSTVGAGRAASAQPGSARRSRDTRGRAAFLMKRGLPICSWRSPCSTRQRVSPIFAL